MCRKEAVGWSDGPTAKTPIKLTKIPDDLTRNPQYISREYIVDDDKISTKALRS